MSADEQKKKAAMRAVEMVEPGMRIGLGTGSTAACFVKLLGERVKAGLSVICVATSEATRQLAEERGITVSTLDETPEIDITFDGADEIDGEVRMIKGGGGALLREKIVAMASDRVVIMADTGKVVETLGAFKLPVEVVPFGLTATIDMIEALVSDIGCEGDIILRKGANGETFVTDNGNYIIDCDFKRIDEPEELDDALKFVPGVVESGLFLDICDIAVIGEDDGVRIMEAQRDDDIEGV
ncbi:MAG: ribose-5-phosphate isomerase RpiA [Alphaproteobacteria bacterium]|nr:ribose-5-phosphate isomerase RpiA [Alphaproteobacteria bacterium]